MNSNVQYWYFVFIVIFSFSDYFVLFLVLLLYTKFKDKYEAFSMSMYEFSCVNIDIYWVSM